MSWAAILSPRTYEAGEYVHALIVSLLILAVTLTTAANAVGAVESGPHSPRIQIAVSDGMVMLEAIDAPLLEVVRAIGDRAGFKTILAQDFDSEPMVSVSFDSIPVVEAVERLVGDKNRIIVYAPADDPDADEEFVVSQVWILPSGSAREPREPIQRYSDQGGLGHTEEDVKSHKLDRITKMLLEDQRAVVRARAATALGTIGGDRAVYALESALFDTDPSVRLQAIDALGRIRTERAAMALGNLLLLDGAAPADRVSAARALWNHRTDVAQAYLRAGTGESDAQVSLASSSAPPASESTTAHSRHSDSGAK